MIVVVRNQVNGKMFVNQNNEHKRIEEKKSKIIEDEEEYKEENDRVEFIVSMVLGELEYNIGHNLSLSTLTDFLPLKILICHSMKRFWRNQDKDRFSVSRFVCLFVFFLR